MKRRISVLIVLLLAGSAVAIPVTQDVRITIPEAQHYSDVDNIPLKGSFAQDCVLTYIYREREPAPDVLRVDGMECERAEATFVNDVASVSVTAPKYDFEGGKVTRSGFGARVGNPVSYYSSVSHVLEVTNQSTATNRLISSRISFQATAILPPTPVAMVPWNNREMRFGNVGLNNLSYTFGQKQTYGPADINLDGNTSFEDFVILSRNYRQREARWRDGDLDSDGRVGIADFAVLSEHFGESTWASVSVPEPSSTITNAFLLMVLSGIAAFHRRPRHRSRR